MQRRQFLQSIALAGISGAGLASLGGCAGGGHNSAARRRPPNILLIVSDDQGHGDLSCHANPILRTPNLDRLFAESTRLTQFITCPLCAPTRASLMTGRHNYRTGVWDTWMGRAEMAGDEVTLAECLSRAGYATGIFGKWHLGENCPKRPEDQGFQEVLLFGGVSGRFDPQMIHNDQSVKMKGFLEDILFEHADAFIRTHCDRPFFAYYPSFMPHDGPQPQVAEEYVDPYAAAPGLRKGDREVYGMVAKFDENVGRLLATLRELDLENDTLVVYFSDNGPLLNNRDLVSRPEQLVCESHDMGDRYNSGMRGGKTTVYEGGIRVPCFVRWPGRVASGRDTDELTTVTDLMPTLLEAVGAELPAGVALDGMSLLPLLTEGRPMPADRAVIVQSDRVEAPRPWQNCCVRERRYKLINGEELYDLQNDPDETDNIAAQHPEIVQRLRSRYEAWWDSIQAGRGFKPSVTIVGSPSQSQVRFNIHHRHSTGWPLQIEHPGPYRVTISEIQHKLFPQGGAFGIRFGSTTFRQPIDPASDKIVFENILLPPGALNFDLWPEGDKVMATMYYGNEDFGYRDVMIDLVG